MILFPSRKPIRLRLKNPLMTLDREGNGDMGREFFVSDLELFLCTSITEARLHSLGCRAWWKVLLSSWDTGLLRTSLHCIRTLSGIPSEPVTLNGTVFRSSRNTTSSLKWMLLLSWPQLGDGRWESYQDEGHCQGCILLDMSKTIRFLSTWGVLHAIRAHALPNYKQQIAVQYSIYVAWKDRNENLCTVQLL